MSYGEAFNAGQPIERLKVAGKKVISAAMAHVALFSGPIIHRETAVDSFAAGTVGSEMTKTYHLDLVAVDAGGTRAKYTDTQIMSEVHDADKALSITTDHSVQFGAINLDHMTLLPGDSATAFARQGCYETRQIRESLEKYEAQRALGGRTMTLFILNELNECGGGAAAAFMGTNLSFYNQFSADTILHELGHNWGNGHQMAVNCTVPNTDEEGRAVRQFLFYHAESIRDSFKKGCGIERDRHGRVNEYSSGSSVMGYAKAKTHSQFYTPNELNRINPERFKMLELTEPYGRHYVSMRKGGINGIKIPLPKDHALKRIRDMFRPIPYIPVDEDISAISFGLQYKGDATRCGDDITGLTAEYDINPIAIGKTRSYVLDTQLFDQLARYPRNNDERTTERSVYYKEPIIYMDDQLDIVVSIGRDEKRGFAPFIDVQTYEQTKTKRAVLRKEVEKRNKLIFGKHAR